jgi:hypothetical protein
LQGVSQNIMHSRHEAPRCSHDIMMMARTWHVCTCTCCGVCVVEQAIHYNTRLLHPLKSPQRAHIVGEVREEKGVYWQGHEDAIQAAQRAFHPQQSTAQFSRVSPNGERWVALVSHCMPPSQLWKQRQWCKQSDGESDGGALAVRIRSRGQGHPRARWPMGQ